MSMPGIHICLESESAPGEDGAHEPGARWVCSCGSNFVWREGFSHSGHLTVGWWPAPAIPRQRRPVRDLIFGARKG